MHLVPLWVGLQDGTLVDTGVPVVSNEQRTPAAPLLPVETSEEELRIRHHARRSRRLESLRKGTLPGGRLPPCGWCQGVCVEDQRSLGADPAALIDRSLALDRLIDQALASREDEGGRA